MDLGLKGKVAIVTGGSMGIGKATTLAEEVAKDGILVNCIHPGSTRTPRNVRLARERATAEHHGGGSDGAGRQVHPYRPHD